MNLSKYDFIVDEIVKLYIENPNTCWVYEKIDRKIGIYVIRKLLKKRGLLKKHKKLYDFDKEKVQELRNQGFSLEYISDFFKVSDASIGNFMRKHNLERRVARHNIDDNYFETIDSEFKSYILGFILGDGCVDSERNKITISLQDRDSDILQKIKTELKFSGEIKFKKRTRESWKDQKYLSFSSKKIKEDLLKLGVGPRKSLTCDIPNIAFSDELFRHFLRGLSDADGTISLTKSGFVWGLCSSEKVNLYITDYLKNKLDIKSYTRFSKNCYYMNVSKKNNVLKILNWMYKDSNIYLNRKYNKYLQILDNINAKK